MEENRFGRCLPFGRRLAAFVLVTRMGIAGERRPTAGRCRRVEREPERRHRERKRHGWREAMKTDTTKGLKAIRPVLDFTDSAETAVLNRQSVELAANDLRLAGKAEIKLDLVPVPGVYLHGEFDDPRSGAAFRTCMSEPKSISLCDADGQPIDGMSAESSWSSSGILKLKWRLPEPVKVVGDEKTQMTQLVAHVFNLENHLWLPSANTAGVLKLEHGAWKGRIRMVKQGPERIRELHANGGYRLTHVVEIDQEGRCFSGQDADRLLQAMHDFLTFANGRMCTLVCPSGSDNTGRQVWARWSSPSEWRERRVCWFDGMNAEPLVELFPGFMDRWATEGGGDALGTAIWWYAQSNSGSPVVDQGIVAAQIATECLSYKYCVCEGEPVSEQGPEQRRASDRYRRLLRSLDIPIEIPKEAEALRCASRKEGWEDGPHALTDIRNRLVHRGRERAKLKDKCYVDAWLLATRLLELAMLAICGFKGECWNRMTGVKEPVPWARQSTRP